MVFNTITSVNEITTWYDLTDILSVMIGCTATFVAIIGGLIANKAISDTAEKESIDKQLKQIHAETAINEKDLDWLYNWIDEYNAKEFIRNNLEDLLNQKQFSEVYDPNDSIEIEYSKLSDYWGKAVDVVKKFDVISLTEKNNDGVPKELIDELDGFQYAICSEHHNCIENGHVSLFDKTISLDTQKYRVQHYNENYEKINSLEKECDILDAKAKLLKERLDTISISKDIKGGMKIFAIVSITNIILPIMFMLFNPTTNKVWYYTETIISLLTFSIGIITMIKYIYSLFPKKKPDKEESEGDK